MAARSPLARVPLTVVVSEDTESTAKAFRSGVNALTAAASRITSKKDVERIGRGNKGWQSDAWDLYDIVGEQRFLINTKAGRVGAARLYAGKLNADDPTQKPDPLEAEDTANRVLEALGETPAARGQLLARASVNLDVAGDGYLVGVPPDLLKAEDKTNMPPVSVAISPDGEDDSLNIEELTWFMLSTREVTAKNDEVQLKLPGGRKILTSPKKVWIVRMWQPHPAEFDKPDSPTRSVLPVLRELVGLTMHISAQIDSRLAGAGVFLVPKEAADAIMATSQDEESEDPFTEVLMEAMLTPIADRSSASALVPLVLQVPGTTVEQFKFISFSTPLDKEARPLREEAIRRLALGQDIPPEVLLGVGSMNHWGAWLVREDTITTYVEPQLQLICDALTVQYLWPVLIDQGMDEAEAQQYVIWYDVDHLISRPNRLADAVMLHQEGVLSDKALRDAGQFTEGDAPTEVGTEDPAASIVLNMIKANASLIRNPGVEALLESVRLLLKGEAAPTAPPPEPAAPEPPVSPGPTAEQPGLTTENGPPAGG